MAKLDYIDKIAIELAYTKGSTIKAIAKEMGVAAETVRKALTDSGVPIRPQRRVDHKQVREMYRQGLTVGEIAKKLNVGHTTISGAVRGYQKSNRNLTQHAARGHVRRTHKQLYQRTKQCPDNTLTAICGYCGTEYSYTVKSLRVGKSGRRLRACSDTCQVGLLSGTKRIDRESTMCCAGCGSTMPAHATSNGTPRKYCDECRKTGARTKDWARKNRDKIQQRRQEQREWEWQQEGAHSKIPIKHPARTNDRRARARAYAHRSYHMLGRKESYYRAAYKRRAQQQTNGPYENIDRHQVFQRDNYRCRICNTKTSTHHDRTHPRKAILGHIKALAAGGTHTWDNVCCLCNACNRKDGVNRVPIQTSMIDAAPEKQLFS